jgi:hypothetical protein
MEKQNKTKPTVNKKAQPKKTTKPVKAKPVKAKTPASPKKTSTGAAPCFSR